MQTQLFNFQYSMIGNFENLINSLPDFSKFLGNSQKNVHNISTITGIENIYTFRNDAMLISISRRRIDINLVLEEYHRNDSFAPIYDYVIKHINSCNRIALNYALFVDDEESLVFKKILSKILFADSDKTIEEVSLKFSSKLQINGKDFNDNLLIQNSIIQNTITFQKLNACIFSIDINSTKSGTPFDLGTLRDYYIEMYNKAKKQMEGIFKKI